jgi:hypothetical protein
MQLDLGRKDLSPVGRRRNPPESRKVIPLNVIRVEVEASSHHSRRAFLLEQPPIPPSVVVNEEFRTPRQQDPR